MVQFVLQVAEDGCLRYEPSSESECADDKVCIVYDR